MQWIRRLAVGRRAVRCTVGDRGSVREPGGDDGIAGAVRRGLHRPRRDDLVLDLG